MRLFRQAILLIVLTLASVILLTIFTSGRAHASTSYSWTGLGQDHTNWTNPQNWSPNGVPGAGDDVSITSSQDDSAPHVTVPPSTTVNSLNLGVSSSLNGGSLTITSSFDWTGNGSIGTSITVPPGGTVNISGTNQELIGEGVTFTLQGTTTVSGTGLTLNNNTIITNTGTLTFEPGAEISGQVCCVSPDQIINQGSFIIPPSGSPQTVTFNAVAFNDNGTASIGSNDTLDLQIAPSTLAANINISGGGTLLIENNASVQLMGNLNLGSGNVFQVGNNGNLSGTSTLKGSSSTFSWTGGTISANLTVAGSANISSTNRIALQSNGNGTHTGLLTLNGATNLSGTGLNLSGPAIITNNGTFTAQPGSSVSAFSCCVNPSQFVNNRNFTIPHSSSPQTVLMNGVSFDDNSKASIGSNSTLDLQIAPSTFAANVSFSGAGSVLIENHAAVQLNGNVSLGTGTTFQVGNEGNLSGTSTLNGSSSTFSWTGGTITANLTVAGSTSISGNNRMVLQSNGNGTNTGLLTLNGATTLSATGLFTSGPAVITNNGTFTPQAGSAISAFSCCVNPSQFVNAGTFTSDVGAGQTFNISSVNFVNTGTVELKSGTFQFSDPGYTQNSGTTHLDGGSLASMSSAILDLEGGSLVGTGAITASVNNAALIDPGSMAPGEGKITISGNYTQTSKGTLRTDIKSSKNPGTGYDQLVVSGTVALNGTLDIETATGYLPKVSTKFTIVTAKTLSGTFATILNTQLPKSRHYQAQYASTSVILQVAKG